MNQVYQIITDRIVTMLEAGTIPWKKEWSGYGMPKNIVSGKDYRGINSMILNSLGFTVPHFLTYKQAASLGGNVRKGEKGFPVTFWKIGEEMDKATGELKKSFLLRYYTVFNVSQCEGLPEALTANPEIKDHKPVEEAAAIVDGMPARPAIEHKEARAYYRPSTDTVNMPVMGSFSKAEHYHGTLFHELIHATGHASRLARFKDGEDHAFGSKSYSKEELIAEMGASFLNASCGIVESTIENNAAYIASWIKILKGDSKLLIHAASAAQKAADFILGKTEEKPKA